MVEHSEVHILPCSLEVTLAETFIQITAWTPEDISWYLSRKLYYIIFLLNQVDKQVRFINQKCILRSVIHNSITKSALSLTLFHL